MARKKKDHADRHPVLIEIKMANDKTPYQRESLYRCPVCRHVTNIDNYDCLGADQDCVFCNQCNMELAL